MTQDKSAFEFNSVLKGETCRGVNRYIIEYLAKRFDRSQEFKLLDIPCGKASFIHSAEACFPNVSTYGCDVYNSGKIPSHRFLTVDATKAFRCFEGIQFDVVTSISGVMEFDNTQQFFESCRTSLRTDGILVVTNDNFSAILDRISYLFLGKARRYKTFSPLGTPTWKTISLNNLIRILEESGFEVVQVKFIASTWKDWCALPFAVFVYPFQLLNSWLKSTSDTAGHRLHLYTFASLMNRHYIVFCQPR